MITGVLLGLRQALGEGRIQGADAIHRQGDAQRPPASMTEDRRTPLAAGAAIAGSGHATSASGRPTMERASAARCKDDVAALRE